MRPRMSIGADIRGLFAPMPFMIRPDDRFFYGRTPTIFTRHKTAI
jgi:hypothetical protein